MSQGADWLELVQGTAPLVVSLPHAGLEIPADIEERLVSPWLARKDADWWLDRLYDVAVPLGASLVRTRVSRTVIDVNRDPSGASLYPGQATTGLCPLTTFDGEELYREGCGPGAAEISERRARWFDPYHSALVGELVRVRARHGAVVLYDAHSIRSRIPRLFEGVLPDLNLGTNSGASCAPALTRSLESVCARSAFSLVRDGRFRGGWTTRRYGGGPEGADAVQMELSCAAYMDEPDPPDASTWPPAYDKERAAPLKALLGEVLAACIAFARTPS